MSSRTLWQMAFLLASSGVRIDRESRRITARQAPAARRISPANCSAEFDRVIRGDIEGIAKFVKTAGIGAD